MQKEVKSIKRYKMFNRSDYQLQKKLITKINKITTSIYKNID